MCPQKWDQYKGMNHWIATQIYITAAAARWSWRHIERETKPKIYTSLMLCIMLILDGQHWQKNKWFLHIEWLLAFVLSFLHLSSVASCVKWVWSQRRDSGTKSYASFMSCSVRLLKRPHLKHPDVSFKWSVHKKGAKKDVQLLSLLRGRRVVVMEKIQFFSAKVVERNAKSERRAKGVR